MLQSHVIEIAGTFAGAAVDASGRARRDGSGKVRFVAVHPGAEVLDGGEWPTLPDLKRAVGRLLLASRPKAQGINAAPWPAAISGRC